MAECQTFHSAISPQPFGSHSKCLEVSASVWHRLVRCVPCVSIYLVTNNAVTLWSAPWSAAQWHCLDMSAKSIKWLMKLTKKQVCCVLCSAAWCCMVVWCLVFGSLIPVMVYCVVFCCTVLYCTVLYCTVLYFTVLYCTVLYCTVLYCTVLYCTVLYCTVLYCTVLWHHSADLCAVRIGVWHHSADVWPQSTGCSPRG